MVKFSLREMDLNPGTIPWKQEEFAAMHSDHIARNAQPMTLTQSVELFDFQLLLLYIKSYI